MRWSKFLPRVGDLFVLQYHRGRRVGIFVRSQLKDRYFNDGVTTNKSIGTVWVIMWVPVEKEKMPSKYLSEITIMNYLRSGEGKIYRRNDGIYDQD